MLCISFFESAGKLALAFLWLVVLSLVVFDSWFMVLFVDQLGGWLCLLTPVILHTAESLCNGGLPCNVCLNTENKISKDLATIKALQDTVMHREKWWRDACSTDKSHCVGLIYRDMACYDPWYYSSDGAKSISKTESVWRDSIMMFPSLLKWMWLCTITVLCTVLSSLHAKVNTSCSNRCQPPPEDSLASHQCMKAEAYASFVKLCMRGCD